jgi:hypothetical protein
MHHSVFQWESYIAVGCTSGIYVSKRTSTADSAGEPAAERELSERAHVSVTNSVFRSVWRISKSPGSQ